MYYTTKTFTFDAAHRLTSHEGLCYNIHGHTYKVEVTLRSDEVQSAGSSQGMIMDFKDLKEIAAGKVLDKLDHAYIYNEYDVNEIDKDLVQTMKKHGLKTFAFPGVPTAENMSRFFFHEIQNAMTAVMDAFYSGLVYKVKVWETPTSYADYKKGGLGE